VEYEEGKMIGFLICPVRGHDSSETQTIVDRLESEGWKLHWPPRDTDQDDLTGYRICQDNLSAIQQSDVVFVFWDGSHRDVCLI